MRYAIVLSLCLTFAVPVGADDITDAITGVDPTTKLRSGTGMVYDQTYNPRHAAPSSVDAESDASQGSSLKYDALYGRDQYRSLRSNIYEGSFYDLDDPADAAADLDDLNSSSTRPIPLGKPDERPGVYYEDDLTTR